MRRQVRLSVVLCALLIFVGTGCGLPFVASRPTEPPPTEAPAAVPPTQVVVATPQSTPETLPLTTPETLPLATPEPAAPTAVTKDVSDPDNSWGVDTFEDDSSSATGVEEEEETAPLPTQGADSWGTDATSLTIYNNADRDICYVLIALSVSDSWGDDWLGPDQVIEPGEGLIFEVQEGEYDLMVLDCDEMVMDDIRNAYLSGEMEWSIERETPQPRDTEEPQPTSAVPPREAVYPTPTPATLSSFLCCGTTPGETGTIWSVNYPANWYVTLLPNNPQQFYGAIFSEPQGEVVITFIPGSNTEPGNELDTGNVDDFLNRYVRIRQREEVGFEEIMRNPLPAVPSGRIWAGTWGSGADRGWEAYLVTVDPLFQVAPGLPQGYLTMYGFRAPSRDWFNTEHIFDQMWNSMRVKRFGGNEEGLPPREPNQKPIMIRWCPKCCDWVAVEADHEDWGCPHCGRETELWETLCE